jgi:hypothetical protein
VQGRPDPGQWGDSPEAGLLRDADPAGEDLGRGRGGQDRMVRPGRAAAGDRSAAAGPVVRAGTGPRRRGSIAEDARAAMAAMPVTTIPPWRAGGARRSARPARQRPPTGWRGHTSTWRRPRRRCRCGRRRRARRRTRSSANW